ncbi:hypothetical protein HDU92_004975 [Lobulomyces angularis]|nr:hypothetical protein HDU92_004975 [Lobulomyces angularis]
MEEMLEKVEEENILKSLSLVCQKIKERKNIYDEKRKIVRKRYVLIRSIKTKEKEIDVLKTTSPDEKQKEMLILKQKELSVLRNDFQEIESCIEKSKICAVVEDNAIIKSNGSTSLKRKADLIDSYSALEVKSNELTKGGVLCVDEPLKNQQKYKIFTPLDDNVKELKEEFTVGINLITRTLEDFLSKNDSKSYKLPPFQAIFICKEDCTEMQLYHHLPTLSYLSSIKYGGEEKLKKESQVFLIPLSMGCEKFIANLFGIKRVVAFAIKQNSPNFEKVIEIIKNSSTIKSINLDYLKSFESKKLNIVDDVKKKEKKILLKKTRVATLSIDYSPKNKNKK